MHGGHAYQRQGFSNCTAPCGRCLKKPFATEDRLLGIFVPRMEPRGGSKSDIRCIKRPDFPALVGVGPFSDAWSPNAARFTAPSVKGGVNPQRLPVRGRDKSLLRGANWAIPSVSTQDLPDLLPFQCSALSPPLPFPLSPIEGVEPAALSGLRSFVRMRPSDHSRRDSDQQRAKSQTSGGSQPRQFIRPA